VEIFDKDFHPLYDSTREEKILSSSDFITAARIVQLAFQIGIALFPKDGRYLHSESLFWSPIAIDLRHDQNQAAGRCFQFPQD